VNESAEQRAARLEWQRDATRRLRAARAEVARISRAATQSAAQNACQDAVSVQTVVASAVSATASAVESVPVSVEDSASTRRREQAHVRLARHRTCETPEAAARRRARDRERHQSSGFDACDQAFGDHAERRAALQEHLQPVSPHTIAACLELFREHMGPAASLGSCAACGVVVLAERDWERGATSGVFP